MQRNISTFNKVIYIQEIRAYKNIHEWFPVCLQSKYTFIEHSIYIPLGFHSYSFNWWIRDGYHLIDDSLQSNIWRHISWTKKCVREWPNISIFPYQLWMIYLKASPVGPRIKVSFLDYPASILGQIQSSSPLFISSSSLRFGFWAF